MVFVQFEIIPSGQSILHQGIVVHTAHQPSVSSHSPLLPSHPFSSLPHPLSAGMLAAGTTGGHVVLWQYQHLPSVVLSSPSARGEPSPQWDHLATTALKGAVVQLKVRPCPTLHPTCGRSLPLTHMWVVVTPPSPTWQWSRSSGVLAVNAGDTVHVLRREVLSAHCSKEVRTSLMTV